MKKLTAILTALCLLCAACAAFADMEIPDWNAMPAVVLEDEDTVVDEAAFEGEWVLNVAFAATEYVSPEILFDTYHYNFMPILIGEGMIGQEIQQDNGEFYRAEVPYTFEAGQLLATTYEDLELVAELLEDGNIVISVFLPGEGDTVTCLSLYMVHPEN